MKDEAQINYGVFQQAVQKHYLMQHQRDYEISRSLQCSC
jgi:hypothetical protein